jgi:hypothetical protein
MTERQLMNMQQLLKAADIDCGCLSIEEVDDLHQVVDVELYKLRLNNFKEMLSQAIPTGANDTEEEQQLFDECMRTFYNTDLQVSFGTNTVSIHNDIDLFDGLVELVDAAIEKMQ